MIHLEDAVIVSVKERSCTLPNHPPDETVILIMSDGATRQISIHEAMADRQERDTRGVRRRFRPVRLKRWRTSFMTMPS